MTDTIKQYLTELKKEIKGSDRAIIQDALADAHEHLNTALRDAQQANPDLSEADALAKIIEQYGSPRETAAAYREIEQRTAPGLTRTRRHDSHPSLLTRFFDIYSDPRAWGGLLFMLISLITALIYFDWTLIALTLTLTFVIILSLFLKHFAAFTLLSIRGLALLEGRIVEGLLGVRMPRRPLLYPNEMEWQERLKFQLTDKQTWKTIAYMLITLPLGMLYFIIAIFLIAFSLTGFAIPIIQEAFNSPTIQIASISYFIPAGYYPLMILGGFLLFTLTLHIAKYIGRLHGGFAKFMLVAE